MVTKELLGKLAESDVEMLLRKGNEYGDSWKKRGGVGAAMMLARKWDRIEKALEEHQYDIFAAINMIPNLTDDIQDLGCYLWLVRSEGMVVEDMMIFDEALDVPDKAWRKDTNHLLHPYQFIGDDDDDEKSESDPWKNLANKGLLSIGNSEIRMFYGIDEVEWRHNLTTDQRDRFQMELNAHYAMLRLGERPVRSLISIVIFYAPSISKYREPISGQIYFLPKEKQPPVKS